MRIGFPRRFRCLGTCSFVYPLPKLGSSLRRARHPARKGYPSEHLARSMSFPQTLLAASWPRPQVVPLAPPALLERTRRSGSQKQEHGWSESFFRLGLVLSEEDGCREDDQNHHHDFHGFTEGRGFYARQRSSEQIFGQYAAVGRWLLSTIATELFAPVKRSL
jgi:hypothetical protein